MYFLEMISLLQEKYDVSVSNQPSYLTIMDIVYLTDSPVTWCSHTLYIGNLTQFKTPPDRPVMLLNSYMLSDLSLPKGSCSGIIHPEDAQSVYEMAKCLLYEDLKSEAALYEITQTALDGKNISHIINTAASLVGNALILVDSNMKVIAHSTIFEIMDPLWAGNVKRGYLDSNFIQKVKSNKDIQLQRKTEKTKIITLEGDIQPKLVSCSMQKGYPVGFLVMVEHHTPINSSHLKQLPQIGKILFDTFTNGLDDGVYKSLYSTVLFRLLSGDEFSDGSDYLIISKVDFPKEMTAVVVRFIERMESRFIKRSLGITLESIFPKGHLIQYKNYIGILVPSISSKQKNELSDLASKENINIGVSWQFNNILDFKRYFYQAVAAIKHAQNFGETNKVLSYTDYSFYDLLSNVSDKTSLKNYCHPALQLLKTYDESNKTELFLTLKTFLKSDRNLGITAEALFLHRNSVTYRINRIVEITDINLTDINTIYDLIYSYRIEDFLNADNILEDREKLSVIKRAALI